MTSATLTPIKEAQALDKHATSVDALESSPKPTWRKRRQLPSTSQYTRQTTTFGRIKKDWRLHLFCVVPVLFLLVFRYAPMVGNAIAFRRFRPGQAFPYNLIGQEFVGLHFFRMAFENPQFWNAFQNTVILGGLWFVLGFPLPIMLALMLNELRNRKFKRFVQTISFLPHFLSIVIVSGLVLQVVAREGSLNQFLGLFGVEAQIWMQNSAAFRPIWLISEAWQTVGWGTILYLAALSTIDDQLYEAARIDGANRWQQTWHVTLPGIRPTIVVLLVLSIGSFMAVGFEKVLILQNPLIFSTGDVISTYLFRVGIAGGQPSMATAIGLFEAVIGLALVLAANLGSRKLVGTSLW